MDTVWYHISAFQNVFDSFVQFSVETNFVNKFDTNVLSKVGVFCFVSEVTIKSTKKVFLKQINQIILAQKITNGSIKNN